MTIEKLKAQEPVFGAWYIDSKLAEGKNSQFYKVYKTSEGQQDFCGLKVLRFPADDKEIIDVISSGKFGNVNEYLDILEIKVRDCMNTMLSLRSNKNIVRFDNFSIVREQSCFYVFILMELLTPLSDYIKFDSIDPSQVVSLGIDLSKALQGFRDVGVIHHGVKPENIYVDTQGNYKLGDFRSSVSGFSEKNDTSPYTAPELFRQGIQDTSSDIYALGILMYKLLNDNRTPFLPDYPAPISLADREAAFRRLLRGDAFPKPKKATDTLSSIILTATVFDPVQRFRLPAIMRAELERYQAMPPQPQFTPYEPTVIPVTPKTFDIKESSDVPFNSYEEPEDSFFEDEDDLAEYPGETTKKTKSLYALIAVLALVLCAVVALIFLLPKDEDVTLPEEDDNYIVTTTLPTLPTYTTEPSTTLPVTTEEITTEEITTEEATTEEPTTEAPTTEAPTTEAPTTEAPVTDPPVIVDPVIPTLVATNKTEGDIASDGRMYYSIDLYTLESIPTDVYFTDIIMSLEADPGLNPITTDKAYICQVTFEGVSISKVPAYVTLIEEDEDYSGKATCYITVDDGDFYYEPDVFQYFLCFEEGVIESDDKISLPVQIKIE